ncbi:MAG TPA: sensor histidine kinase [Thermomicrobiales bacterium]|jgi:signal transduction histidine kinase|nr:sensor histidine kinase [Thermomicrobiales bacterium]
MDTSAEARRVEPTSKRIEPGFALLFSAAWLVLLSDELVAWSGGWSIVALLLGILCVAIGIGVFPHIVRNQSPVATFGYVVVQLALGIAVFSFSHPGGMFLLVLTVGQAVRVLPLRWVVAMSAPMPFLHAGMEDRGEAVTSGAIFLAAIILTIGFSRAVERERRARAELDEANRRLRAYAAQAEELATMRERNRMAREIHDTLAQGFTGILLQLEGVDSALDSSNTALARERLEHARVLGKESLAEARRSVWSMRPRALEHQTLPDAVRDVVNALSLDGGPEVRIETIGEARPLPPEVENDLLRVAQEAIANATKHAGARNIILQLRYDPAAVELRVNDDGHGFAPERPVERKDGGGFGLTAMRERLERHGGELGVHSAAGMGTALVARIVAPVAYRGAHE